MSAHAVPSTVTASTSAISSFVTTISTPVSTGVVYSVATVASPTTSHASAATAIFRKRGNYQISATVLAKLTSVQVDVKINLIATTASLDEIALYIYIQGPSCSKSAEFNCSHRDVLDWHYSFEGKRNCQTKE